jgi:hypothetical protein
MNPGKDKIINFIKRILSILVGSGIYWIGYWGFLTHLDSVWVSAGCLCLIIIGLIMAGWNSSYLFRRK